MVTNLEITTSSPEHTLALGRRLSAILGPGDVVCLYGTLGSGKTQLVRGICQGLDTQVPAISPSFTLVNEYPGRLPVYHFDCYRLHIPEELEQIGFDEYLNSGGLSLIEWADRIATRLPEERLDINLQWVSERKRRFIIVPHGYRWRDFIIP